jgi:SAM-dependent methyltransferase
MLSPAEWQARYRQQAVWTASMRCHLYQHVGLHAGQRAVELGCGAGAISGELATVFALHTYGLDLSAQLLRLAAQDDSHPAYLQADAYATPLPKAAFDFVLCHMFLLWIARPAALLAEAMRLLRPGGWMLALAEPDHAARIDAPPPLDELGHLQTQALTRQGAHPQRGRQLAGLFSQAGFVQVESGLLGGQWSAATALEGLKAEWQVLRADLAGRLAPAKLEAYFEADRVARQRGERVLFVPTFYAIGQKDPSSGQFGG